MKIAGGVEPGKEIGGRGGKRRRFMVSKRSTRFSSPEEVKETVFDYLPHRGRGSIWQKKEMEVKGEGERVRLED